MFHYDNGLKLTAIDLAVDVPRRQPRAFVSHAHADHMARHELAFCTPQTAALYRHRLGDRPVVEMPYGKPRQWGGLELSTLPAGHVLGAAMLLANDGRTSLLYTGDFRLRKSLTAGAGAPVEADVLVMESTFGKSRYRLPARAEVVEQLLETVDLARKSGETPVIFAYVLGKAQEVTRILTDHDYRVMLHPLPFRVCQVYESQGCPLGDFRLYDPDEVRDCVVIFPPPQQRSAYLPLPARKRTIAVTGWAMDQGARFRTSTDVALPLSDHADFDELLECVERVKPRTVYCTHGPESFANELQQRGYDARVLGRDRQLPLVF